MTGRWWRANRFWLPLVPVALVALLAASSYHVKTFWYDSGPHDRVAAATTGHFVSVDIPYEDTAGRTAYRFRVRLDGLTRVDKVRDDTGEVIDVPQGATAYRVRMSFSADPSVALRSCLLSVVDSRGRVYGNALDTSDQCVPARTPGPEAAFAKGMVRGKLGKGERPRPSSWTVAPAVLVAKGAAPTSVRITFGDPQYVSLPVPH